jgi:hypothetical protein
LHVSPLFTVSQVIPITSAMFQLKRMVQFVSYIKIIIIETKIFLILRLYYSSTLALSFIPATLTPASLYALYWSTGVFSKSSAMSSTIFMHQVKQWLHLLQKPQLDYILHLKTLNYKFTRITCSGANILTHEVSWNDNQQTPQCLQITPLHN